MASVQEDGSSQVLGHPLRKGIEMKFYFTLRKYLPWRKALRLAWTGESIRLRLAVEDWLMCYNPWQEAANGS